MKRVTILAAVLCFLGLHNMLAQQTPLYTQYMFQRFIINPAIAGTNNYYQIRSSHRFQWTGISDGPITNAISCYGPHSSKDMGFGGYIYNDITGPTSTTGLMGSYGYNISITPDIRISGGLSLGLMQYKLDMTKIEFYEEDEIPTGDVQAAFTPDAKVGVYLYSTNYHFGISADQLLNNKFRIDKQMGFSRLKSHFYIIGGYNVFLTRDWALEPTFVMKKVIASPLQAEISCKTIYQKMVWGALSFRTMDAFAFLLGYIHNEKIYVGYSYDIGVSPFRTHHSGSHEVMIGYKFDDIRK